MAGAVADLAVVEMTKRATNVGRKATNGELALKKVLKKIRIVQAAREKDPGHLQSIESSLVTEHREAYLRGPATSALNARRAVGCSLCRHCTLWNVALRTSPSMPI